MIRCDSAVRGSHACLCAGCDLGDATLFKDARASGLRRLGEPEGKVQRMKMSGPIVNDAALVVGRRAQRLAGVGIKDAMRVIVMLRHVIGILVQIIDVGLGGARVCNAGFKIDVWHGVRGNQIAHQRFGLFPIGPKRARMIPAQELFKLLLVFALARAKLTSVAARRAKADALRLEHDNATA